MISLAQIEEQLKKIGCNFRAWGRSEVRELPNILMDDEIIAGCANGRYEGGFALLCVTNHRILLVDRKPMFLTLEDIRFDMIAEIDFAARLLDSTMRVQTPGRTLVFTGWNHHRMRKMLNYTQQRVMEIRQHYLMMQQFQQPQFEQRSPTPSMAMAPPRLAYQGAPTMGGVAMRGGRSYGLQPFAMAPYPNPYTKTPLLTTKRQRRPGKFHL